MNQVNIFVSSIAVKHERMEQCVKEIAKGGYKKIELTGGTHFYPELVENLLDLKEKYNLTYLVHNYFPPPEEHFFLNVASLNKVIRNKSQYFVEASLDICRKLDSKFYGFHAPFYIDPVVSKEGLFWKEEDIAKKNGKKTKELFLVFLKRIAQKNNVPKLFIENNCYSQRNFLKFKHNHPSLFLTSDYLSSDTFNYISPLCDIGHFKIIANLLNIDYVKGIREFAQKVEYWHISDNDGAVDLNLPIEESCILFEQDIMHSLRQKKHLTFSLEVKGLSNVHKSCSLLEKYYGAQI